MKDNLIIEQTLMTLSLWAKNELDNYKACNFEKAIVIDLYGLDGTDGLSRNQIIEKYKDVSASFKGFLLDDLHNVESKAYHTLKCIVNTRLYNTRKANDIEYVKKTMNDIPQLQKCYDLTEGIVNDNVFNQLVTLKLVNMQTFLRLFMFSRRLKLDLQKKEQLDTEKSVNQKAR